tara:strand:- start:907 stop:1560 length:654 start_codon:yes stop_codon:yes gene_type:complete
LNALKGVVGLILCRKGSVGVPKKNTRLLKGIPLYVHQVNNLKKAGVEKVYVSTNDKTIIDQAKKYGFIAVRRPEHLCKNTSKCEEALRHFTEKFNYNILVFAQATSPMCDHKYIKQGLEEILKPDCDSVVSVCLEHWLPRWSLSMNPIDWDTEKRPRRQDVKEVYVENGSFYITTKKEFLKSYIRYSGRIKPVVMPHYDSFQVDTEEDFEIISRLIK